MNMEVQVQGVVKRLMKLTLLYTPQSIQIVYKVGTVLTNFLIDHSTQIKIVQP